MTRALYHRAKKAIVRRRLRERAAKKREREASLGARVDDHGAQPSPSQRPRYGEGNTTDDDVTEFDDFHLADIAGADDEWVDEPGGDLWEPYTAATVGPPSCPPCDSAPLAMMPTRRYPRLTVCLRRTLTRMTSSIPSSRV